MTRTRIQQIFYSAASRAALDPGFEPLDNLANERPDWREYWPIRRYLLDNALEEGCLYGFFSPRFGEKTGLDAAAVHAFVEEHRAQADVIAFSPYFDQSAVFLNPIEQALAHHPGARATFEQSLELVAPGFDAGSALLSSANTVFCNFFVAGAPFWRRWLERCEILFEVAERGDSPLAAALRADVVHGGGPTPAKTFVIERVVSVILATEPRWRVAVYNPLRLPMSQAPVARLRTELLVLDALKLAHGALGFDEYRLAYLRLRQQMLGAPASPGTAR